MSRYEGESPHTAGPDDIAPCLIRVDKEGRMWHQGAEMTHEGINSLLRANVRLDEKGRYLIRLGGQECFVEVEDTFFVIIRAAGRPAGTAPPEAVVITLNDGTKEELDPATVWQNKDNVLYALVKDGRFPARFLRPGYYQLAEHLVEKDGRYVLPVGGGEYPLAGPGGDDNAS
ncbi:MAG: hypothetical protein AB1896_16855 [Thermodesulfobacteriota bacterium]